MDPELECFMRIKPKPLARRGSHALADGATCLAGAPAGAGAAVAFAAGGYDDTIVLLDSDAKLVAELEGHPGGTNALAFAPPPAAGAAGAALLLVSAGEDGTAAVWDCGAQACRARLACEGEDADKTPDGHTVSCVSCSPDGALAACAAGKTVHLFALREEDVEGTRRVFPPSPHGVINDIRFAGRDRIVAASYGGVVLFGIQPGQQGLALEHASNILSVSATPDLSWIVGGCMDATVHIWRVQRRASPAELPEPEAAAAEAAPRDGAKGSGGAGKEQAGGEKEEAAEGEEDEEEEDEDDGPRVSVVEGPDGGMLEILELTCGGYSGKVNRADFGVSVDGDPLLASSGGNQCMIWDFGGPGPAGSVPAITLGHTKAIDCQAWHPSKPGVLVTGGRDGRILLYEAHNAAEGMDEGMPALCGPAAVDPDPSDEVVALAWTGGGALASAHSNGDVKIWDWEE
ncbi:hypothetical protein Rsub_10478 [Raphidocelis subcapitata]|uniref:Uncharacterized protein n=1 Tax=Raphidocelis subcapitata TaxID=307507 RepID=A0A2V0PK93_9CHLO|nr:hypothetical protein Rsub_10478 [Raphidocelis subcapitata]|eukprot:GBF98413.1 hypothetical protein Rsub_10478 [Raphidocelis subcapitata]